MELKISYSAKRKRTVSAKLNGNVLEVVAPRGITRHSLDKVVDELRSRIELRKIKSQARKDKPLEKVFQKLNAEYFENKLELASIMYSSNQKKRYGSCNHITGDIKISTRLKEMPEWVRDYVIMHEMAHLAEPDHGKEFHRLLSRYKLAERARGYLMAVGDHSAKAA